MKKTGQAAYLLLVLWGVSFLSFGLSQLIPGDPAEILLKEFQDGHSLEQTTAYRQALGLDKGFVERYGIWLGQLCQGDLGRSWRTGRKVIDEIAARFPATLELALGSFLFVILLSSALGFIVAWNRNKSLDRTAGTLSVLFLSLPNIWLGTLLTLFFSFKLHWFPVIGRGGVLHLVLPVLTLGLPIAALQGRVLRTAVLEVMSRDHCRFALAKGLRPWAVFKAHVFKNALPSVISLWGITLGHLISGSFVVESIFSWPGLGRLMVEAVMNRDLPLIQGLVFLTAATFVIINKGLEWAITLLDPRLKASGIQTEGTLF